MTSPARLRPTLLAALVLLGLLALLAPLAQASRTEISLSGKGWRLWHDKAAAYLEDELVLPPVDLSTLPVRPPTGGWSALDNAEAVAAHVPGTLEEFLQKKPGPEGDLTGVSWWYRSVTLPAFEGRRLLKLRFEAARQRAEVFVNRKLVGYDMVGNSPFEVELGTDWKAGDTLQLAVRITDAGGNFDWRDGNTYPWGQQQVLGSHGFGGLTGDVKLIVCDPVHFSDLAVLNTPEITGIKVLVEISNPWSDNLQRDLTLSIVEAANPSRELTRVEHKDLRLLARATSHFEFPVSAPDAKPWDLDHPELYRCIATLSSPAGRGDSSSRRFGFRWFAPEGIGQDATFRLNGRRIVLRSAISWGFWPVNGITPSAELAEREVRVARQLGQNMLNFHRCIGQPSVFDKADELGLLIYEEPGNWKGGDKSPLARAMANEKLRRMVLRDRSRPSLVMYNLINEDGDAKPRDLAARTEAMAALHSLDPSRVITRTSGWSKPGIEVDDPMKLHLRPYDATLYSNGWYDFHHAGGPATWNQGLYRGPSSHYNHTGNRAEIVFWGEEGAISTPPRLGLMRAELLRRPHLGWDGASYLDFHAQFEAFLDAKRLRSAFPDVDALTGALGAVSLDHQGRKIQLMRAGDVSDGYAVNGWEAELIENHSGIVDAFRNPKGDPTLMARYNQPLYVAVLPRAQVGHAGEKAVVDFYLINELNLSGAHRLEIECHDPAGRLLRNETRDVTLLGGDRFGQLLVEGLELPFGGRPGFTRIRARIVAADGTEKALGEDQLLCVDWRSDTLGGKGAVFGQDPGLVRFLQDQKGVDLPAYSDTLGKLDWIVVARAPGGDQVTGIPETQLRQPDNPGQGLRVSFYTDKAFTQKVGERTDRIADFNVTDGAAPDPSFKGIEGYHVRWEGLLVPTVTGTHSFAITAASGGVRLRIADTLLIDGLGVRNRLPKDRVTLHLDAGKAVPVVMEYSHMRGTGRCKLLWAAPDINPPDLARLLARVRDDGTRLVVLDFAEDWMPLVAKYSKIDYKGSFRIGTAWVGGIHFVREHPLFRGLPTNVALGWPYQALVVNGNERRALTLSGEELVVGAWHCNEEKVPMALGTAVGLIPCGKGTVLFSTLAVSEQLDSTEGPAHVARKLLCNFITGGSGRK